jgi:hypothetical protein
VPISSSRRVAALVATSLLLVSCGADDGADSDLTGDTAAAAGLALATASFDLAVGPAQRLIVAVFTDARERVVGGEVTFRLAHLGDQPGGEAALGAPVTATFLPVPGLEPAPPAEHPRVETGGVLTGVYRAEVALDEPGFWGLYVEADLGSGGTVSGRTVFRVLAAPEVVTVGDPAPATANLVRADVEAGLAPASALDSRLRDLDERDRAEALHRTRISDALAAGRPMVVAITTPVYCVSLVCGPLTDHLLDVAERFADRADFVHIEVWEDFEAQRLNAAAAAWIQTEAGGNEPWVFLVDATGRIAARWDNVLDTAELEALLSALPVLAGA